EVALRRESSLEERERAVRLMEITHALQSTFSVEAITSTLVQKVRALLDAALVVLYSPGAEGLETRAVATLDAPDALGAAQAETLVNAEGAKLLSTLASELPAA